MMHYHYSYVKKKDGNKTELWFTDTDRLTHETKTRYVFHGIWKVKELFNFSKHLHHHRQNRLVLGKIEDETSGVLSGKFVESKPEMYFFL